MNTPSVVDKKTEVFLSTTEGGRGGRVREGRHTTMTIIIGIDPGSRFTGYGVIRYGGGTELVRFVGAHPCVRPLRNHA